MTHYKYRRTYCPNQQDLCDWLEKMSLEGWEFVSIDYTRLLSGVHCTSDYQYYIFRQPVIETTSDIINNG